MASTDPLTPANGRTGLDVLDLLAEEVLHRLDARVESVGVPGPDRPDGQSWLRVSEVARNVGASKRTVYRALRSGALAGERLGAHWRIRPASVEAWLAAPRPPRTAVIAPPERPAEPRAGPRGSSPSSFVARARRRQEPPGGQGRPSTSRGAAAWKEQR